MASVVASDALIARKPDVAAAAVRAIVGAQKALKQNVDLAFDIGRRLFPQTEASLIVELIRRDLPYYDAAISREAVGRMIEFAIAAGILKRRPGYAEVVAEEFAPLWAA
jgi:ABC-type nitrate/sulfonate/bicarbonate transport system substrate-binding protein